jgi:hypothetical protein
MATLDQLASHIRFQLEQLSERNAHHEFEHLCRHLARARICSNILPATGPVSAHGDQGRDFESFRTYLHESPIANSSFVGLVSEGAIAFACTLTENKQIESKIKSDIETIMGSGTPVIDIHYFCTTDVPSGLRHKKLQQWAKYTHDVLLEVHDGQAISEYLTAPDIFWIAVRFLNIPSELYPSFPVENGEKWYYESLQTWKQTEQFPDNYADFSEIKSAIRHSTFTESAKRDLPFWIEQLELLIQSSPYESLRRRATYEIAVASLRGLGSMIGYEKRLSDYFDQIPLLTASTDIEDTSILWTYCLGSYYHNASQVTVEDLNKWREQLIDKVKAELQNGEQPGKRCFLLQTLGFIYLKPQPGREVGFDIDQALKCWFELTSLVHKVPLFPLESFADRINQILEFYPFAEDNPDFEKLTHQIDELLAKRHGDFVAAEKSRDRSVIFYNQGKLLRAIKEIHRAKVKWFAKETLRGSLLGTLFMSNCYHEIGLAFGAKYYALVVAYIALHSDDYDVQSLIPRALVDAASCDYRLGAYCSFFDFTDACLIALNMFSTDIDASSIENEINQSVFHTSILRTFTKRLAPNLLEFVDNRIKAWGLEIYFDRLIPESEREWADIEVSKIWEALEDQMCDRPFNDLGQFRSVKFLALGVTWKFIWENTYELTLIAEELLAVLQIILADIASDDWYLLRTTVEVAIHLETKGKIGIQQIPSNEFGLWRLSFTRGEIFEKLNELALELTTTLLEHCSLLPTKEFVRRIEDAFQDGLGHKIFFGQRYSVLYTEFVDLEKFESPNRRSRTMPEANRLFQPTLHDQLNWHSGFGPGYSVETAREVLKNRYERPISRIQFTLKRLGKERSFKNTVHNLRASGWLDWHVLSALSSVVLNYRVNKEVGLHANPDISQKRFIELMELPEDENAIPVPLSEFSEQNLRNHLWFSMAATLKHLGFELHQITPDFEAISDFLGKRYNYWTDDIDHPDYGF